MIPFYKWQSRMLPHVLQVMMERPGHIQAQAIRASTMYHRGDDTKWIPKRVKDLGLAIPLGPQSPEGQQKYLANIDLPHEGALQPFVFGTNTTVLAVKQGAYLRGFVYAFIELLAPAWDKRKLEEAFK